MSTGDLQNYYKFHQHCMASDADVCFKMIPQPVWMDILGQAMLKVETVPLPPDMSGAAMFLELFETFLTNRMRGRQKEDLLRGAPWEDEESGRHYFRLAPLEKFFTREGVKPDYGAKTIRPMLMDRIRALGGGTHPLMIKGNNRSVWWVPVSAIENAPELDIPPTPKEIL